MPTEDSYLTIQSHASAEIKISRSKFIANAFPVNTSEEADLMLSEIRKKFFDARHHPYAYVLREGGIFRYNDDGEPGGSSGKPIYDAVNKYELKNVIVIVTRYFGGVKLGVGGLKRAYFESAEECLKSCKIREIVVTKTVKLRFSYAFINPVMKYLEKQGIKVTGNNSGEKVDIDCDVRLGKIEDLGAELKELTNGSIEIIML